MAGGSETAHCAVGAVLVTVKPDRAGITPPGPVNMRRDPAPEELAERAGPQDVFAIKVTADGLPRMLTSARRLARRDGSLETVDDFSRWLAPEQVLRIYIEATGGPADPEQ